VGQGVDQEGPGFYFSSDKTDASSYAYPKGTLITAQVAVRKLLPAKATRHEIDSLVKKAPELDYKLANWGENPEIALKKAIDGMLQDPGTAFQQVWFDFYRYEPAEYLKNLVSMGYSGHQVGKSGGVKHLIVYDPKVIKVLRVENVEHAEE
jgi:hypothetical protein